jgi:multisubunit Na+/H+ antiporter MnhG subunit
MTVLVLGTVIVTWKLRYFKVLLKSLFLCVSLCISVLIGRVLIRREAILQKIVRNFRSEVDLQKRRCNLRKTAAGDCADLSGFAVPPNSPE